MPYHQLFYHIVWSTKHRQPLLTPEIEPVMHEMLRTKAIGLGASVFALNGMTDHVHLVASIPPAIAVAKFIGQVKGSVSTRFNKGGHGASVYWQDEYGVFSFDAKRLPNYIAYVERQKEHHAQNDLFPVLERTEGQTASLLHLREDSSSYYTEATEWRNEMLAWDLVLDGRLC